MVILNDVPISIAVVVDHSALAYRSNFVVGILRPVQNFHLPMG